MRPESSNWPLISAKLISLKDARKYIPSDMPSIIEEERRELIAIRRMHVQKRYRAFLNKARLEALP